MTGRSPTKPARTPKELQERVFEFWDQERLSWLRRPRIHTAIFEQVCRDEEVARHGWSNPGADERLRAIREIAEQLNWSEERLSTFRQLVVEYRQDPTIERYLIIKRTFPEVEIQVGQFAGIDPLFALESEFSKQGIDPQLVAAALDGDEPSVDALSMRLLELIASRASLPKSGPKHIEMRRNAVSDAMVNFLITTILEAFDWHQESGRIPGSFVVLVRHQLCGSSPDLHQLFLSHQRREAAAFIAAQRLQPDEKISVRKLAAIAEVPRGTAARWLADATFVRSLESRRKLVASSDFQAMLQRLKNSRQKSPSS